MDRSDPGAASRATAILVAVTPAARRSLRGESEVRLTRFPFKVGREGRLSGVVPPGMAERRLGIAPQLNDVYLIEQPGTDLLHISREHFQIERDADGRFYLVDRQSVGGTVVAGQAIGGNRAGGRIELHDDDVIVVGTSKSPYLFRFEVLPASD